MAEPVVLDIVGCARCHGDGHPKLRFAPLAHPIVIPGKTFTHWAACPTNGEPILLVMESIPEPADG